MTAGISWPNGVADILMTSITYRDGMQKEDPMEEFRACARRRQYKFQA
jgi:hypothetical protein